MRFDFYNDFGALNSPPIFSAFEKGLIKHGHTVEKQTGKGDVAVIWSVLWNGKMYRNKSVWDTYRSSNRSVVVLEVGGLKRDHTWKIGVNGINKGNFFVSPGQDSTRRRLLNLELAPWKTQGQNILICTQHEKSLQWKSNPKTAEWAEATVLEIKKYSNRPIVLRAHPRCPFNFDYKKHSVLKSFSKDFYSELSNAWSVITWNSNPGIESVIRGIPTLVDKSSLAWPVSIQHISKIENPELVDREQWLNDLAWTEWTAKEMEQGIPQEHLLNYLQLSKITGSSTDVI
jgi:hypothetical protein